MPAPLFSLLGLEPTADDATVRATYKRRAGELHPDRNPGFREEATQKLSELNAEFSAYSADPAGYRAAYQAPPPKYDPGPDAAPGEPFEVEDAIELVGSLVELFAPAQRLDAARRAVASGARVARRYAARPPRG